MTYPGAKHDGVNFVSQRVWLDWIEEKFKSARIRTNNESEVYTVKHDGCRFYEQKSVRPLQFYQNDTNWFLTLLSDIY